MNTDFPKVPEAGTRKNPEVLRRARLRRQLVEFSATQLKSGAADLLEDVARHGAVALTKHGKAKAYVISPEAFEEYLALKQRPNVLDALNAEFDEMFKRMQGPEAEAGANRLLNISPEELSAAAVKGAKRG